MTEFEFSRYYIWGLLVTPAPRPFAILGVSL